MSEAWSSTEGSFVNVLEKKFSERFNAKYAIAMNSGTSTLHAALEAIGVSPGDEILTPALTVFMDTSSIIHANCVPVYVDVDENTFCMDVNKIEEKITNKTKAIIVVSLYGYPSDIEKIMEISNKYNLVVIEDNAQHPAEHRAHITSYSFENTKHISCGEGGMVVTNNEEWARKMRLFGNHGFRNSGANEGRTKLNLDIFQSPLYERHSEIGWNYRMSEFQAAVSLAQLERIDDLIKMRRDVAKMYKEIFDTHDCFEIQKEHDDHTYWTFAVSSYFLDIDDLRKKILEQGGDRFYCCWQVPYMEPVMKGGRFKKRNPYIYRNINFEQGLCAEAEFLQKRILQFKTNYRDIAEAREKINILKEVINNV